ncbi:leucyl/phenylalanyl-tRNA--protein transferase [cyanobacterium endosymbiont of Rhopalodia gibberula]|uniref:leucyl/phenylalanyl-tRNA--protein transferase n=1 Tax=cyanobacterium endosymbiont of Rhopalodia gibberula TaxID=1763363 RepID=UPI000DC7022B|nr:leucyl/phenylalanyl-tRNA--protein transferase [cyanobacterium endosymbiont of Rhopalodia gibberula]BBA79363.1 leucyl/phenylalanyl-tRNA--protein transferase [cyanobacterium endosymbiont of Rhopalodia gibberula]
MEFAEDTDRIIQGYAQGYFVMADEMGVLGWYSSRQRALIPLDKRFHYPKSLQRILNQQRFSVEINRDFLGVCRGCAKRETTWISPELIKIYHNLYQQGWAYSFETWQGNELAGGILGIAIRGAFIGESMFYQIPDASKVAMVKLVEFLKKRNFVLFDAQLQNSHLERFGAYQVSDRKYKILLQKALAKNCVFGDVEQTLNSKSL